MEYIDRIGNSNLPDSGLNVDTLGRSCGLSADAVRNEIAFLIEEGNLYSTSDDDQ